MLSLRIVALAAVAAISLSQAGTPAQADHRWRMHVLWPKIYSPYFRGYVARDEDADDDEFLYEDEDETVVYEQPRRSRRQLDLYSDDDFEPLYEPPKKLVAQPKKKIVAKKVTKPDVKSAAVLQKPKTNGQAVAANVSTSPANPKASLPQQTASLASSPAKAAIGCTKGIEIVAGYGFSDIKPQSCKGPSYVFGASRANKSYVIKLASATGEITDVKKVQ